MFQRVVLTYFLTWDCTALREIHGDHIQSKDAQKHTGDSEGPMTHADLGSLAEPLQRHAAREQFDKRLTLLCAGSDPSHVCVTCATQWMMHADS